MKISVVDQIALASKSRTLKQWNETFRNKQFRNLDIAKAERNPALDVYIFETIDVTK